MKRRNRVTVAAKKKNVNRFIHGRETSSRAGDLEVLFLVCLVLSLELCTVQHSDRSIQQHTTVVASASVSVASLWMEHTRSVLRCRWQKLSILSFKLIQQLLEGRGQLLTLLVYSSIMCHQSNDLTWTIGGRHYLTALRYLSINETRLFFIPQKWSNQ